MEPIQTNAISNTAFAETLPPHFHRLSDGTLGDLLLIIDMQNVYLEGQPWGCRNTAGCIRAIQTLLTCEAADQTAFTVYLAASQPEGVWKTYNEENRAINDNPWMNDLVAELKPAAAHWPVFAKHTYSSLENETLRCLARQARRLVITGVVAECCVLSTVFGAIDAGCKVVYLTDAVTGLSAESEAQTEQIVRYFSPLHTEVMTTAEYLAQQTGPCPNKKTAVFSPAQAGTAER